MAAVGRITAAQHAMFSAMRSGPRVVAQRQKLQELFGGAAGFEGAPQAKPAPVVQRALKIGGKRFETDAEIRRAVLDALGPKAPSFRRLLEVGTDPEIEASFDNWKAAAAYFDDASAKLSTFPLLPPEIAETEAFKRRTQPDRSMVETVKSWALVEMKAVWAETTDVPIRQKVKDAYDLLTQATTAVETKAEPEAFLVKPATVFQMALTQARIAMFTLLDRQSPAADGSGGANATYGYHLTKLHNIPMIRTGGLDPNMGASDRGSVAMSTEGQKTGSVKTSEKMVAFASLPTTFRPYINQAEDRRQMIEGAPLGLKPIMLRFHIGAAIGRDNVIVGADFMDANALNTKEVVRPQFIDVMTPEGWVPIQVYDTRTALLPMRSGNDDARLNARWKGKPVALTWSDLQNLGLFGDLANAFNKSGAGEATRFLEAQRDKTFDVKGGVQLTFRGASMQTSGNPLTWDYAFSADGKVPEWLDQAHGLYMKKFQSVADKQLREFDELRDR